jgi:hypothetical protein
MYIIPFLLITKQPLALLVMWFTHALIDRYRLARYVNWLKNGDWFYKRAVYMNPKDTSTPSGEMWFWTDTTATGYPEETPDWLAVWLLIITDNIMHITINALALYRLG